MSAPPCGPEVRCRAESGRSPNAASGRNQRVVIFGSVTNGGRPKPAN